MSDGDEQRRRILAVSSGGGHWVQLVLVVEAFSDHELSYATTLKGLANDVTPSRCETLPDFNLSDLVRAPYCALVLFHLFRRVRPEVVVSTGAAPGLMAILFGRLTGCRTIWIDSITNAKQMSLSGRVARHIANHCLTQWPHLARPGGPEFMGSIL